MDRRAVVGVIVAVGALASAVGFSACGGSANGDDRPASDAQAVEELYRDMQRHFEAGDGQAFCESFGRNRYTLAELSGELDQRIAECAGIVNREARAVQAGRLDWPAHRVSGVEVSKDGTAYVQLAEPRGTSFLDVQFTKWGDEWIADFQVPDQLEGMNGE